MKQDQVKGIRGEIFEKGKLLEWRYSGKVVRDIQIDQAGVLAIKGCHPDSGRYHVGKGSVCLGRWIFLLTFYCFHFHLELLKLLNNYYPSAWTVDSAWQVMITRKKVAYGQHKRFSHVLRKTLMSYNHWKTILYGQNSTDCSMFFSQKIRAVGNPCWISRRRETRQIFVQQLQIGFTSRWGKLWVKEHIAEVRNPKVHMTSSSVLFTARFWPSK